MKKYNNKILIIAAVIISLVVFIYMRQRILTISDMNKQAKAINTEISAFQKNMEKITMFRKVYGNKLNAHMFVENLYIIARNAGVKNHEVNTSSARTISAGRQTARGWEADTGVKIYTVRVAFEGNHRETAEYLRELQNMDAFKKIILLEMKSEKNRIKSSMTLEVLLLEEKNAA